MKRERTLYKLEELSDYKIASGNPDIRNWEVRDADNRVVGKVDSLFVNKAAERVVYVEVAVDPNVISLNYDPYAPSGNPNVREFINKDGDTHVIVPIGMVDLDTENNVVHTPGIDHRTFATTKRYQEETPIDRDYEKYILSSYNRENLPPEDEFEEDRFYDRGEFESKTWKNRE